MSFNALRKLKNREFRLWCINQPYIGRTVTHRSSCDSVLPCLLLAFVVVDDCLLSNPPALCSLTSERSPAFTSTLTVENCSSSQTRPWICLTSDLCCLSNC